MPHVILKRVWDYCTYNKPSFLLVLLLFGVLDYLQDSFADSSSIMMWMLYFIVTVPILGYGMTITRDRINKGVRLPKIITGDVIVLGIKSFIVFSAYLYVQGFILDLVCSPLDFPHFDLEEMLFDFSNTLNLLFSHNPIDALVFVVLGAVLFYITMFFTEIAIAMLADTNSFWNSFNLLEIKKNIDLVGWKHYTKDYTMIVLAIVIFGFFSYITIPIPILEYIWVTLIYLLMFVTQFMGIGRIYSEIKEKKSD
jgi:hypothetical protein